MARYRSKTQSVLGAFLLLVAGFGGGCATVSGGEFGGDFQGDVSRQSKPTSTKESEKPSAAARYFRARLADAADIFSFSLSANVYGAKATVSKLGVGIYSTGASLLGPNRFLAAVNCGHRFLWRGGFGKPACRSYEVGLRNSVAGTHRIQDHTILIHFTRASRARGLGVERAEETQKIEAKLHSPLDSNDPEDWTRISVSAGFILGAHVSFNPGALLDFVLGWFGVDIMEDDV